MNRRRLSVLALFILLGVSPLQAFAQNPENPDPAFWHVGLVVQDLDLMHRFYAEVIGLEPVTDLVVQDAALAEPHENAILTHRLDELMGLHGSDLRIRHYSDPTLPMFLELLQYPNHPGESVNRASNTPLGLNHLGLTVLDTTVVLQRMEATGLGKLLNGPIVLPEFGGNRYTFVADPEGNRIELQEMGPFKEPADEPSADVMAQMSGQRAGGDAHPGAALYTNHCAACHDKAVQRAPHKSFLEMLSADMILSAMDQGVMQQQASALDKEQRQQVVEFLVGEAPPSLPEPLTCDEERMAFDFSEPPRLRNWGMQLENTRFIPADVAGLEANDVSRLELKWAFAFPNATRARSQPGVAGGALFVGSQDGTVYSIERETGCVRWRTRVSAEVRTGISIMPWSTDAPPQHPTGYFGDLLARVYAIDLATGEILWSKKIDDHPNATVTAQPVFHEGKVHATVSSLEVVPAADPGYPCCSFRGSVVTLDAGTGELLRKDYTIPEAPREVGQNTIGTPILAPSGAPSWNSPTIDTRRGRLYIGTGSNYSSPAEGHSDAIIAFNIAEGGIEWVRQTTADDAWNLACMPFIPDQSNCPVEDGPDVDFGSPPLLVRNAGRDILVAGQKSGVIYGISPDNGDLIWNTRVGRGGNQGGMHFGMAADGRTVLVPISDYDDDMLPVEDARPGIYALDAFTGDVLWSAPADNICGEKTDCDAGISAAITAISGAVFAGHMDGRLRAYDNRTGAVLWEFDADREFESLNGAPARGGSFGGGAGTIVVDGMVFANSGYGLYFHRPGNVLLAFTVPDTE